MKLTEKDIALFKQLHESAVGEQLCDYVARLCDFLCDIRQLESPTDVSAIRKAVGALEKHLINKIKLNIEDKSVEFNEYQ